MCDGKDDDVDLVCPKDDVEGKSTMLSRLIGEGPTADAGTVQAAILKKEDDLMKKRLHNLPLAELESVELFRLLPAGETDTFRRSHTPAPGSEEDLYQQQRQKDKADAESHGASKPLMRDTLPNRPREE